MSHAPAPWKVAGQSEGGRYITVKAANGRTVARVPWNTDREADANRATDHDDAVLIASAPEMLQCLEGTLEAVEWVTTGGKLMNPMLAATLRSIRATIAQAEGR